jgi:hypothetical protein
MAPMRWLATTSTVTRKKIDARWPFISNTAGVTITTIDLVQYAISARCGAHDAVAGHRRAEQQLRNSAHDGVVVGSLVRKTVP